MKKLTPIQWVMAFLVLCIIFVIVSCSPDNQSYNGEKVAFAPKADEDLDEDQVRTYHFLLGEIALDRDEQDIAIQEYVELSEATQDPLIAARGTSVAIERENYAEAAKMAKVWANNTPEDLQTQVITASIILKTDDIAGVQPFIERFIDENDETTFQHLLLLKSTLEDEAHTHAFIEAMKTFGINHNDHRALFMGATTAHENDDIKNATLMSDKLVEIKPDWLRGAVFKIQLLYEAGEKEKALASIQEMIKHNPNDNVLKYLKAKMLMENGDLDGSMQALNQLRQDPEYRDEALLELARLSLQKNDFKTADKLIGQYLQHNPNDDEAKYFSAFVAHQMGNYNVAMDRYASVKQGYYFVNARIQMALLYAANDYIDEAIKTLDETAKQYPEDRSRIDLVRTQVLLDGNRIHEAYAALNNIIKENKDDIELVYIRGLVAMELGETTQSEKDFRHVLTLDANHLDALNDLSTILIGQEKYNEAMVYTQQALKISSDDPEALDNMGWILHNTGETTAAIPYLEKANHVGQNNLTAVHLGEVLWQTGDQKGAIKVWNDALKRSPNNQQLIQVMRKHLVYPAQN